MDVVLHNNCSTFYYTWIRVGAIDNLTRIGGVYVFCDIPCLLQYQTYGLIISTGNASILSHIVASLIVINAKATYIDLIAVILALLLISGYNVQG